MVDDQEKSTTEELHAHPLVAKATSAAGEAVAPLVIVKGYLGEADSNGRWRLYTSPGSGEYLEFDAGDVVEATKPEDGEPNQVWLRPGSTVQHVNVEPVDVQATFLQGPISARYLPSSESSSAFQRAGTVGFTTPVRCGFSNYIECTMNQHVPACNMRTEACGSIYCGTLSGALCPTGEFRSDC